MTDYKTPNSYSSQEASHLLHYLLSQLEPIRTKTPGGVAIDPMKEAYARIDAVEAILESQKDHRYLLEIANGKPDTFSHLGAILGYEIKSKRDEPRYARAEMALALFEAVMNKAENIPTDDPDALRDSLHELFRWQSHEDINLLHMAVSHPSIDLVKTVFAKAQQYLPPEEYSYLLANTTRDKATVLSNAMRSKDSDVVDFVFEQVKDQVAQGQIAEADYRTMLVLIRDYNTSLLQSAVKSGIPAIAAVVFEELEKNVSKQQMQAIMDR